MPNIHPTLVHFPIALLTVSLAFDIPGKVFANQLMLKTGWWTMLSGCIGLLVTVASGLLAKGGVAVPDGAESYLESHQQIAFFVVVVFAVLLFWRIASKASLPQKYSWVYIGLSLVGVLLIWVGAWYGGEMVFRFGMGVTLH